MKKLLETIRTFFVSPELALVICGVYLQEKFSKQIEHALLHVHIPDDLFKWAIAIPGVLLCWSLVSGRKILFPEKDKSSILQKWPDYWKLRICFHATLSWNIIFLMISIYAWTNDWTKPSSIHFVALAVSILGSAFCSLSLYNAQTRVEEEISQYKTE
ncbi:hypothetical protein GXB81_18005 [Paraburkholderia sp. Ac-20336]|uniref:hypothetical protein n=1 Tax=Paraburkholderia sp. Ac-20336 TaxID=2703886 RepID=UPI00197E06E3|nr:hypothetical protein [Paraburkholderia sp. Ac-20336]MBN3804931.1 hypothetical protein [Paraburkholderia sp. Ac-20336]